MANQYKNKIVYGQQVLIDLTDDTVTTDVLRNGYTAHAKDGSLITGSLTTASLLPIEYDYNIGYIAAGSWVYENPTQTYIDIYEAIEGHIYYVSLGGTVGTRFRAMFTTVDIRDVTSGTIKGTQIVNTNNPNPYAYAHFTAAEDGYILIAKDNIGNSGLKSYVYDKTAWT